MSTVPPTIREIDAVREQADRFVAELDEEYYLHFAGHKETLDLEPIYERHAELTENRGNIALLGYAGRLGLIPAELAARVASAYREFRRCQHASRLQGATQTRVEHESVLEHAAAVRELWELVLGS